MIRAIIPLVLFLVGCERIGQDNWQKTNDTPMKRYVWTQTSSQAETAQRCGIPNQIKYGREYHVLACAIRVYSTETCYIFSHIPEEEAKSYVPYGMPWGEHSEKRSIYAHELAHCGLLADGIVWRHD